MSVVDRSRRVLLLRALSLGALGASAKLLAASCAVPGAADAGMRQELHYVEAGAEPAKRCAVCAFFSNLQGSCGTCQILSGPANPGGHCDSWAARS